MALETMTTKYKILRGFAAALIFLFFSTAAVSESYVWTVGAEKFKYSKGQKEDAVTSSIAETIPSEILEKLSNSIKRNVMPDEQYERTAYKLRTERQSLYLQLTSEYKKRDSIVINTISDSKLKAGIKAEEKKIAEIEEKIKKNIEKQKQELNETERRMNYISSGLYLEEQKEKNEIDLYRDLFKNIFVKEESYLTEERLAFYQKDVTALFTPSEKASESYDSQLFEKEVYSAGINALVTGTISEYEGFISVSVDLYIYPGAKKSGSVMEVGTVSDVDFITSSISRQLLPYLANAMPVEIFVTLEPQEAAAAAGIYIDDVLQKSEDGRFVLDSGIHNIQFVSEGYRTAGTTYFFDGNKKYNINVQFEKRTVGALQIGLRKSLDGTLYANSEKALTVEGSIAGEFGERKSQISINGNVILGEFIAENGESAFFYIPKKLNFDGNYVTIKPVPRNRSTYINTRRKWMYGSYTLFMISLIPTFYTYGNYLNQVRLYKDGLADYESARGWQNATNITRIISIGCGVFWGYELVRYLLAADSVLPQNARQGDVTEFKYYTPEEVPVTEDSGVKEDEEIIR